MRYTTKSSIIVIKAYVIELVQIAENTDLCKFSDTGQENKTQITIRTFQYTVKRFHCTPIGIQQRFIINSLQKGFIVFVDQYNHLTTGLLPSTTDNIKETFFRST